MIHEETVVGGSCFYTARCISSNLRVSQDFNKDRIEFPLVGYLGVVLETNILLLEKGARWALTGLTCTI